MQAQHSATSAADWAGIAEQWRECGALWRVAGGPARRALALLHATRAFVSAGAQYAGPVASHPRIGCRGAGAIGSRLAGAGTGRGSECGSARIAAAANQRRAHAAADAVGDHRVGRLPSDDTSPDELARTLSRTASSGDPGDPRLQEARARARVRVALLAARAGRPDIAQAVLLPTAIEYPLLDRPARAQFAEVNRLLLAEADA